MLRSFFAALAGLLFIVAPLVADDAVYELRIYTCEEGKLEALHTRFKDHTMEIFEKHGMENVGYWTPIAAENADNRLIYVLRHKSRDAAKASWDAFRNDPEWKQVAKESREKHGKILAKAPESTFMQATDYSPAIGKVDPGKVYELRTYRTNEGKLAALNTRFRDYTDRIFARHGIKSFAYWTPLDAPDSENLLIYILEHHSPVTAKAAWKKFGGDPEWQEAKAASEKDGKLLSEAPESVYMMPTKYSPVSK